MSKKVGRNQDCVCGRKVKYKRCCEKIYRVPKETLIYPELRNEPNGKDVKWRTSYKNLPNEIVEKIDEFLNETQLYSNCCHYVSNLLSLSVDGIDVVKGWYGEKENREYYEIIKKECHSSNDISLTDINDKWSVMTSNDGNGSIYIDKKTYVCWIEHSWNKYEGKYFDLNTELDTDLFGGKWVLYNEHRVMDMTPYRSREDYCSKVKDFCLTKMNTPSGSMWYKERPINRVNVEVQ